MEWRLLISAHRLVMLYISTKFCEIISISIKVIERTRFLYWKLQRGNNSAKKVGGVTVVDLCTLSSHALYFYQVLWNYLKRYQSYRADTISIPKISKGNNSPKKCRWKWRLLISARRLVMFYISTKFLWNYLKRYQSYRADTISIPKISKGNNSAKNVGGVTVFDLCTSSGHALYFPQVLWNYLKRFQSYRAGHDFYTENYKGE